MQPFVEIRLEENGCDVGWDPVFSKLWSGIEGSCIEEKCTGKCSGRGPCSGVTCNCLRYIGFSPPLQMTELEGVSICGRRGGLPFVDTLRPNSDGQCPPNTVPCSRNTSIDNTICVEQDESECGILDKCPITEIWLATED